MCGDHRTPLYEHIYNPTLFVVIFSVLSVPTDRYPPPQHDVEDSRNKVEIVTG